jgi:glutaminyl-peptide cyclotransferase
MRRPGSWATRLTRLKTRWLEVVLLIGFAGLVVWLGFAVAPGVRSLLPTPSPTVPMAPSPVPTSPPTSAPTPVMSAGKFDGSSAFQHVQAQMAIGPRPTGSDGGRKTGDYIVAQLQKNGWQVEEQKFVYRGVQGRNIIGRAGKGPGALIGAHYDTRRVADEDPNGSLRAEPVPGANDGASGVAVLLELARTLDKSRLSNEVWLTFFDAEDNGRLDGWDFIAGSTEMASRLTVTPEMVVIADMVGDRDLQLYKEQNSTPDLVDKIWRIAARLGYEGTFLPTAKWSMLDDHTPFLKKGIPAVDLIDFDYPYWHTTQDTADKVAPESLEQVGRVLQVLLEGEGE